MIDGALRFLQSRGDVPSGGLRMMSSGLDPLLAEALVMLRASSFTGAPGDDWVNEGTAGGDAVAAPTAAADNDVPPVWYSPADGMGTALRGLSIRTNEGDAARALFSTPDAAALDITGDITLRARFQLIPAAFDAPQGVIIRKTIGTADAEYLFSVWSLVIDENGDLRFNFNEDQNAEVAAGLSNYGLHDVAMDYDSATGDVRAFVAAPAGAYTIDGDTFDLVGTNTSLTGAAIETSTGPLTFMIAKGWGLLAQVFTGRVGETMVKVAEFDPEDSGGLGDTSWTAGTGETWTAEGDSWIVDPTSAGWWLSPAGAGGFGAEASFTVADDPAIDLGTGDGTIVFKASPTAIATANFSFWVYASKATGTVGSGGVGWVIEDFKFDGAGLDGFGVIASDGTDTTLALHNASWTVAEHLCVITFDRDGSATLYIDGVSRATGSMTATPGAVGDISTSTGIILNDSVPNAFGLHAFGLWDRLLTSDEVTRISTLATNGVI